VHPRELAPWRTTYSGSVIYAIYSWDMTLVSQPRWGKVRKAASAETCHDVTTALRHEIQSRKKRRGAATIANLIFGRRILKLAQECRNDC